MYPNDQENLFGVNKRDYEQGEYGGNGNALQNYDRIQYGGNMNMPQPDIEPQMEGAVGEQEEQWGENLERPNYMGRGQGRQPQNVPRGEIGAFGNNMGFWSQQGG